MKWERWCIPLAPYSHYLEELPAVLNVMLVAGPLNRSSSSTALGEHRVRAPCEGTGPQLPMNVMAPFVLVVTRHDEGIQREHARRWWQ